MEAQKLAVNELVLTLEEEGVMIDKVTLGHLASGREFIQFARWLEAVLKDVGNDIKTRLPERISTGSSMTANQLAGHGRWIGGGKFEISDQLQVEYGMGVLYDLKNFDDVMEDRFPDPFPVAVVWAERNPSDEEYKTLRDLARERLKEADFSFFNSPRTWILAYRAKYLTELMGDGGSEFREQLRKYLVDSVVDMVQALWK